VERADRASRRLRPVSSGSLDGRGGLVENAATWRYDWLHTGLCGHERHRPYLDGGGEAAKYATGRQLRVSGCRCDNELIIIIGSFDELGVSWETKRVLFRVECRSG